FPQASLSLPLSRERITAEAEAFLQGQGLATKGFRNLTLFDPDEQARLYLERELGLQQANRLMSGEVPVWRWRARWFRPPGKEEMIVHLRPDGRLVSFEHRVLESAAGARLDPAAARSIAETFLRARTSQPMKLIAEQRESRPGRDDHVFTWEQENFKAGEATLRRTVVVQGDRAGSYREFLHVPEQWQRDFATLRSSNELYAGIAQGFYVLLIVASLGLLIVSLRARRIRWTPLIRLCAVAAAFFFLNELNTLPFAIDGMQTSMPYEQKIALALLQAVAAAVGVLLYMLVPAAAGSSSYAARYPSLMPLEAAFSLRGMATRSFFRATVAGFGFAACHLIFLTAFYLAGAKAGVWSPQDVAYSDVLATPIPWVYPVAIALMASGAEEFWFRLLAMPVLQPLVRLRWIAVVLPAMVWGFLHANYPQQPGWIRGVEVGLIGIAAGYLMLRFGIVATLVWHYVIDAFLIGSYLFKAEHWLYRVNGAVLVIAILSPLIISLVLYRRNGGFLAEPERPAPPLPIAHEPPAPLAEPLPAPWPEKRLWMGAAAVLLLAIVLRPVEFGDFLKVEVSRDQAVSAAHEEMRKRNLDPAAWQVVADFAPNLRVTDFEYLRQHAGARRANDIFRERMVYAIWRVRFFRPLAPEEWVFYVNQRGQAYRFDHVLDEKAAGAQLSPDQARAIAIEALRQQGVAGYSLVDSQTDKLARRTDHSFVWEDPEFQLAEARARVAIQMVGDEACEFRRFFKLPEQWLRDFARPKLASYVMPAFFGVTIVPLVLMFVRRLGSAGHRFHWRVYASIAAAALLAALASEVNNWPALLRAYDTSTPLATFYGQMFASRMSTVLFTAAGAFLAALAADTFVHLISPGRRPPALSLSRAAAIAILLGAAAQLSEWLLQQMPGLRTRLPLWELEGLDAWSPAITIWLEAMVTAFGAVCAATVYVCGGFGLIPRERWKAALAILAVVFALSRTLSPAQLPFTLAAALLLCAVLVLILMTCATDLASIGVGVFLLLTAGGLWRLLEQPLPGLAYHAAGLVLLAALTVAGVNLKLRRNTV
ncbi:MAG: CPBP family intramembrane glutamic endopeptidase, partial [Bryobacteraceae bacterium]|nr:CPBP family intramembrane glutamic endopeptidase [Bryobacteraceae bacterium]